MPLSEIIPRRDHGRAPGYPPKIPVPIQFQPLKASGTGEQKQQKIYEQPMRVLEDSHSQLTKHVTERVDWFVEALTKIGWSAMLIAFQTAQISSAEAFSLLDEFRDADRFVQAVREHIPASVMAAGEERCASAREAGRAEPALRSAAVRSW